MRERWPDFLERGARALCVSFAPRERLADYQAELALPFPIGADPERRAYRAYGLVEGRLRQIWGVATMRSYLELLLRGRRLKLPARGDDLSQLGGDFIVGPAVATSTGRARAPGPLWYAHASRTPADRPTVNELLAALDAHRAITP